MVGRAGNRAMKEPGRRAAALWLVAGLFFAAYAWLLLGNFSVAVGGSDSSGYANAARLLARGRVVEPIEELDRFDLPDRFGRVFMPLAHVPGPKPGTMAPFYPIGMSLHIAGLSLLTGWSNGPYLVSPLAALGSLLLIFLVGRELGLSRELSLAAAAILGVFPDFLSHALQPMSDVLATFWCLAAILAALAGRRRLAWSAAAGAAFGIAVLVRPTNALLLPALLVALPFRPKALALFAVGGVPFAAFLLAFNQAAYGSLSQTGYIAVGLLGAFALRHVPANIATYAETFLRMLSPLVPLGFLALVRDRRVPRRDRVLLFGWFGVFVLAYCFYNINGTRFLLPAIPAMILGFLLAARDLLRLGSGQPVSVSRRVFAYVLILTVISVAADRAGDLRVLRAVEEQGIIPESCRWAEKNLPAKSLVLASDMGGALKFYTGLIPVRWDYLEPEDFSFLRERTEAAGYRWFALVLTHEVPMAAPRLPGSWTFVRQFETISLWKLEPPAGE